MCRKIAIFLLDYLHGFVRSLPDSRGGNMKIRPGNATQMVLAVIAVLATSTLLRADVTGSISGVVRDRSQAVVAGAHVQITNVETNLSQETTSASDGTFRILALPVGKYRLTTTSTGFRTSTATD